MTFANNFKTPLRFGATALMCASALAGCSTVKSISPFTSNVPYAQAIEPTLPRPAQTEIPAFKPAPPKPPEPKPAAVAPVPEAAPSAPAAPPPPAPQPSAEPAPPPPPAAEPSPAPASVPPPAPQSSAPEAAPAPKVAEAAPSAPIEKTQPARTADLQGSGEVDTASGPQLPAEHREFKDDGTYPSLAQVPARPPNLPTFAEAKKTENALLANNAKAKDASPDSPAAPSVGSKPDTAALSTPAQPVAPASAATPVAARTEDKSPCLGADPATGGPTATLRFAPGSSAMTSNNLQILAEAMPVVRGAKGTIRVFGHGDTDVSAQTSGRFDLAAARAGAVAQALTGFGIAAPRIAVGVACRDAATAGASVQLYTES